VAGQPIFLWFELFGLCFEWVFDGGIIQIGKGKIQRTGQYRLREWPEQGGMMNQYQKVIDILFTIAQEKTKTASKT